MVGFYLWAGKRGVDEPWKGVQEMTAVICPKCGTENPGDATNCQNCQIILKLTLERADKQEPIESSQKEESIKGIFGSWWAKYFVLGVVFIIAIAITNISKPDSLVDIPDFLVVIILFSIFLFLFVLIDLIKTGYIYFKKD